MRQLILVEERSDPGENGAVFPPVQVKSTSKIQFKNVNLYRRLNYFAIYNRIMLFFLS